MEVALQHLGYTKGSLQSRIDKARDDGHITESLRKWAHHVRLEGNEAIHELEASDADATDLIDFLKLFMEVAFVLPTRIPAPKTPPTP